jgi:hypothetical protein
MSDSSITMYVVGTLEYDAYSFIEGQMSKERGDDLEGDSSASFNVGGILVITVEQV